MEWIDFFVYHAPNINIKNGSVLLQYPHTHTHQSDWVLSGEKMKQENRNRNKIDFKNINGAC